MITIQECYDWSSKREDLDAPEDSYIYEDAYEKARNIITPLEYFFIDNQAYKFCFCNAFLHYVITTPVSKPSEDFFDDGATVTHDTKPSLYEKYNTGSIMYASVTDGSSSTSPVQFKSLMEGDFVMNDLTRTPYGSYVYTILEQMKAIGVLL